MIPARCARRVPCSITTRMEMRRRRTVSMWAKSTARIACAWVARNCRRSGADRRGAGSKPAALRIFQAVEAATRWPSPTSSPWMRR